MSAPLPSGTSPTPPLAASFTAGQKANERARALPESTTSEISLRCLVSSDSIPLQSELGRGATPGLARSLSISISAASKDDHDRTQALLRRVQSTTAEASASLNSMVSTMRAAQHVRDATGQLVAQWLAGLSVSEIDARLRDAFDVLDADGSNALDKAEFVRIAQVLGPLTCDQISALFAELDTDGSGTVSYAELQHMVRTHLGKHCDSTCTVCTTNKLDDHPRRSAARAAGVDGRRSDAAQTQQAAARRMPSLPGDEPLHNTAMSDASIRRVPSLPRAKSTDNEQSLEVLC